MLKYIKVMAIIMLSIVLFYSGFKIGQVEAKKHPGMEEYKVTNIEWLAIYMNSIYAERGGSIEITYMARYPGKIFVLMQVRKNTPYAWVEKKKEQVTKFINSSAKKHGFNWVNIEIKVLQ